jgi:uncharacterized protein (TIGR00290 family)
MRRKTLLSWSSGKDSAWALYMLRQDPDVDVVALICTVNKEFDRVAMHGVKVELVREQAKNAGLPLWTVQIPYPCSNEEYDGAMTSLIDEAKTDSIEYLAFGDLFLEEVRRYREERLKDTGITPLFPLWGMSTKQLSKKMINGGLKAVITCIDPKRLSREFVGREYNECFLDDLPVGIDSCGENGEFHSFAFDGPMFHKPIGLSLGKVVDRDGFVFADLNRSWS